MKKILEENVLDLIKTKSVLKRDVFELTKRQFKTLKKVLKSLAEKWQPEVRKMDPRLEIAYKDLGEFYCQLTIAGDILIFYMHTNVFRFAGDSYYWKSGYLQEDSRRGFCGTIKIYNFLADSFRFHRENDVGYMIARLFINHENHFFLEGKKELGYLFNDFIHSKLTANCIKDILLSLVKYSLEFDLYSPNYAAVQRITVKDASSLKDIISLRTGKRLGFQFKDPDADLEV